MQIQIGRINPISQGSLPPWLRLFNPEISQKFQIRDFLASFSHSRFKHLLIGLPQTAMNRHYFRETTQKNSSF